MAWPAYQPQTPLVTPFGCGGLWCGRLGWVGWFDRPQSRPTPTSFAMTIDAVYTCLLTHTHP